MRIGILGAGMIGGTLGRLWHAAGHETYFATRHPDLVGPLVRELGEGAFAGTPREAARWGEVILLAVPLAAIPEVAHAIAPLVDGKVVLDACNAYTGRDGALAEEALGHPGGSSGWVASHLPGARLVKAFNTVYFQTLQEEADSGRQDGVGIPLAGDDPGALAVAEELVHDAGFTPVVLVGLARGKQFQPGTPVYNTGMRASEVARALGVADETRPPL